MKAGGCMYEAIAGVVVGFALSYGTDYVRRKRSLKVHWETLGAEIRICAIRASNYLYGSVSAPLYRLPLDAYKTSFPVLLAEADLKPNEYMAIGEFYSWANDINRGLENADEMRKKENLKILKKEHTRNLSKCNELLSNYLEPVKSTLSSRNIPLNVPKHKNQP
jgi:hypothetical protein